MRSHLEPFPAGQFPYYGGSATRHLGWLKPIRFTARTILCEVTKSSFDKPGMQMRFNRETGRLMSYEPPSLRNYMRPRDFEALMELGQ